MSVYSSTNTCLKSAVQILFIDCSRVTKLKHYGIDLKCGVKIYQTNKKKRNRHRSTRIDSVILCLTLVILIEIVPSPSLSYSCHTLSHVMHEQWIRGSHLSAKLRIVMTFEMSKLKYVRQLNIFPSHRLQLMSIKIVIFLLK